MTPEKSLAASATMGSSKDLSVSQETSLSLAETNTGEIGSNAHAPQETISNDGNPKTGDKETKQSANGQPAENVGLIETESAQLERIRFSADEHGILLLNSLMPYLAAGFKVAPTSGKDNLARTGTREEVEHIHAMELRDWIMGNKEKRGERGKDHKPQDPSWIRAIEAWRRQNEDILPEELLEEQVAIFNSGNYLDINGMSLILDSINDHLGTHYSLGYIADGYKGKIIQRYPLEVDRNYIHRTTARLASTIDDPDDTRPIIWVRNDNAKSRWALEGDSDLIGHWCGFTPFTPNRDKTAYTQQLSTSWGLDDAAEEDKNVGVWIVHTECPGGETMLKLYKGVFIRQTNVSEGIVVPSGHMFMATPDGRRKGLVPTANLTRVEELKNQSRKSSVVVIAGSKAKASMKLSAELEMTTMPKSAIKTATTEEEEPVLEITATKSKTATKKPKMAAKKHKMQPLASPKVAVTGPLDFEIFRAVSWTDKIGTLHQEDDNKKFVDSFSYSDGDFLLQHPDYPENQTMINILGELGHTKPRALQHLREPWGLPKVLPGPPKPRAPMSMANTVVQLKAAAQERGLAPKGLKRDILGQIQRYDDKNKDEASNTLSQLPMYRVLADVPASEPPSTSPPFWATEVVLKFDDSKTNDNRAFVKDYEGRVGRIVGDDLEMIDSAWGITVDSAGLHEILGEMHGGKRKRKRAGEDEDEAAAAVPPPAAPKKKKKKSRRNW